VTARAAKEELFGHLPGQPLRRLRKLARWLGAGYSFEPKESLQGLIPALSRFPRNAGVQMPVFRVGV
jgi:hypothetical protein